MPSYPAPVQRAIAAVYVNAGMKLYRFIACATYRIRNR